jgi:DNA-binding LacI/PurR family transcriptional regulator
MKQIVGAFGTVLILVFELLLCVTLSAAAEQAEVAKSYKAAVIAEIENSDFNPTVMAGCIDRAADVGYTLTIQSCVYDEERDIKTAEVTLAYRCEMPLLGIAETRTTRGIAR